MSKTYLRSVSMDDLNKWVEIGWRPLAPDFDRIAHYKIEWKGEGEPPLLEEGK